MVSTGNVLQSGVDSSAGKRSLAAAAILLLLSGIALGQELPTQGEGEAEPREPYVAELFAERADLETYLLSIEPPDTTSYLAARRDALEELETTLADIEQAVSAESLDSLTFEALIDLQTEIRSESRALGALSDELQTRAYARDAQLDELADRRVRWNELTDAATSRAAPQSVLDVAAQTIEELERTESELRRDRDAALEVLTSVARVQNSSQRLEAELRNRRADLESVSQLAADLPMWRSEAWSGAGGHVEVVLVLANHFRSIVAHVTEHWPTLAALLLGIGLGAHWLLKLTGARVEEAMQRDETSLRAAEVFKRPHSAAILAALLGVAWLGPPAPQAFVYLIWAIIPFPAAALAVTVFAKPIRLSVYTIAVVLAIMALKPFIDPMPLVSRFVLLAQALAMATAIMIDYRRGGFADAFPRMREPVIAWLVRAVCLLLLLIVLTEVLGLVGLANTMRSLVLGGLGLAMIFTSVTYVIIGLVLALLHVRPLSALPVVRNEGWTIIRTVRRSVRFIMMALWLIATLNFSGLFETMFDRAQSLLDTEIGLGAITVHVSALAVGFAILFATWLVNRFVKFILAGQSLSGSNVSAGFAYAASKILGYAIVVAGVLFAIAAMGFDITRVTLLAGALGVGIGFGLQNIVNNFFSGLILLFEQPIKINDIAAVDNLMGKVKAMNIRSTVIETFDGAEVIVPNGDLISKTVTNWTKSNRRRRVEIDVGVAYGTEPQKVLDILEDIARRHEEVTSDPAPFATFTGFGDSSLNFRLYIWLEELSQILTTPSKIRQEILDALVAAGIEIPFPQRDIRVTMAGGDPVAASQQ